MPKYLLLKHYRGGHEPHHPFPPMDQWAPEDVEAHMAFLRQVGDLLRENGEYVDGQALTPAQTWVRSSSSKPGSTWRARCASATSAPSPAKMCANSTAM